MQTYPLATAIFVNEGEGKSALVLNRDLGANYPQGELRPTHKLRETMAEEMKGRAVGGIAKMPI